MRSGEEVPAPLCVGTGVQPDLEGPRTNDQINTVQCDACHESGDPAQHRAAVNKELRPSLLVDAVCLRAKKQEKCGEKALRAGSSTAEEA